MNLIQLEINGKTLPLPKNVSISLIEESPIFSTQEGGGEYSLSFNIPLTPESNQFFSYCFLIDSSINKAIRLECRIILNGTIWRQGTLIVREASESYNCYYQGGVSSALSEFLENDISTFDFPEYSIGNAYTHAKSVAGDPFSYDYSFFPISAPNYSDNPLWSGIINQYDVVNAAFIQNSHYSNQGEYEFESVITPFPRIYSVLKIILEGLGYTLDAPIFEESELAKRLCLLNPNSLSQEFEYNSSDYQIIPRSTFKLSEFLPSVDLQTFIFEVNRLLGCTIYVNELTKVAHIIRYSNRLSSSELYLVKGKVTSSSVILDSVKEPYFKFKPEEEVFVPGLKEELIDPNFKISPMVFTGNQNAYRYNAVPTQAFIPEVEFSNQTILLNVDSSDFNDIMPCIYDGITGPSISFVLRPYGYPQGHTIKYDDIGQRFNHFYGTLQWEGTRNYDYPVSNPVSKNGLFYSFWDDWFYFLQRTKLLSFKIIPTAEDLANLNTNNTSRIGDYNILIKSMESQANSNKIEILIKGYLL